MKYKPKYIHFIYIFKLLKEDVRCSALNSFISSDGVRCSKVAKTELSESKETKKEYRSQTDDETLTDLSSHSPSIFSMRHGGSDVAITLY